MGTEFTFTNITLKNNFDNFLIGMITIPKEDQCITHMTYLYYENTSKKYKYAYEIDQYDIMKNRVNHIRIEDNGEILDYYNNLLIKQREMKLIEIIK